jgi:hypothetical protein
MIKTSTECNIWCLQGCCIHYEVRAFTQWGVKDLVGLFNIKKERKETDEQKCIALRGR